MPFGLSSKGINIFQSVCHRDYNEKKTKRCEVDERLEELSKQI